MNWYKTAKNLMLPMPTRKLGETGWETSVFSLGGQGSLESQGGRENCLEIIKRAHDLGVNYFDTSPVYGPSEDYYGEALREIPRKEVFLATKTDKRDRDGSLREIEKSLKRLGTDYVDLWQIHHLDEMEEVDEVTGDNGALEALLEMQEQGVVKNLGITGHAHPDVLLEIMSRHDFDTVLCPINPADSLMKPSFVDTVVKEANKQNMGVIGMKVFSQGYLFDPEGITTSWEPIAYAVSQDISTVIVGHDNPEQLENNVAIVKGLVPLQDNELKEIEKKVKDTKRGAFFRREHGNYNSQKKLDPPYLPLGKEKDK